MSKKLVIVESPAKARTIKRILGSDYNITASMGHIRDLPAKSLGIDIEHGFEPIYVETRKKLTDTLKKEAKDVSDIYLAPDPDREGEAIAWHLKELLAEKTKADFHRVAFHEITKSAVNRAFENPGEINSDLVDAQQARRVLDRLVGYQISPLLWSKVKRGVSAGRVQSVALRMVCERERDINEFKPVEYWIFDLEFEPLKAPGQDNIFKSRLIKIDGEKAEISNGEQAAELKGSLEKVESYVVSKIDVKPQFRNAPPPFITSTLQQAAGTRASQTMRIAQQLYEGIDIGSGGPTGLITYMRTDSVAVAAEAQQSCRGFINSQFGQDYVPEKPNFFKSKSSAQGAHEAIRPTDVTLTPEKAAQYLDKQQLRLYSLIWKRFVSSQMAPAKLQKTTVDIEDNQKRYIFRSEAVVTLFDGFTILRAKNDQDEQQVPQILGKLAAGDGCSAVNIIDEQKFTEPPPRYTEASLIRELEANGIGRPSTYATIVQTIQNREYCNRIEKGRLQPTELGFQVCDYLVEKLPRLFEINFTSEMENKLDDIEEGKLDWRQMMSDFYGNMSTWLNDAKFAGAPETEQASALIKMMDEISKWNEPEKRGRRTYDDKKFYNSIKKQFDKENSLTEKQWQALLNLAIKYKEQLPEFEGFVKQYSVQNDVADIKNSIAEREAADRKRSEHLNSQEYRETIQAFELFDGVAWDEPVTKGSRTYDDAKFFGSLKKQAESGKTLSEKQQAAFIRLAVKYMDRIQNPDKLKELLELSEQDLTAGQGKESAGKPEIEEALNKLSQIQNWAAPEKKGKRVFDDKAFYESLKKQYEERKSLSSRQEFALKKLVGKYEN